VKPSEPILTPGWEGFVVLDARGYICRWPNSTPKLYPSAEAARHSLNPGETLAPISFRPAAFTAMPPATNMTKRVEAIARGFGVPAENVVRAVESIRPKAVAKSAPAMPAKEAIVKVLDQVKQPLTVEEIAEAACHTRGSIQQAIPTLLRKHTIDRSRNPEHKGRGYSFVYFLVRRAA